MTRTRRYRNADPARSTARARPSILCNRTPIKGTGGCDLEVREDLREELFLLLLVHGEASGRGAPRLGPGGLHEAEVVADELCQAVTYEHPGAHVLGLLLQPRHLVGPLVPGQDLRQLFARP